MVKLPLPEVTSVTIVTFRNSGVAAKIAQNDCDRYYV